MINSDAAFNGHRICDSPCYINGVTLTNGQALVGPASYNPDQDGIAEFAELVNERVADTIPAADLVAGDGSC
jgi:hypothetical protein